MRETGKGTRERGKMGFVPEETWTKHYLLLEETDVAYRKMAAYKA